MFFSLLIFSPINQLNLEIRKSFFTEKEKDLLKKILPKNRVHWIHKYLLINISSCINQLLMLK